MKIDPAISAFALLTLMTTGCGGGGDDRADTPKRFDAISADEKLTLIGTEPFWNMTIEGDQLTYSTPDNAAGIMIPVSRFSGNNGLGLNGTLDGEALQIAVTPAVCSDGMSDREYPYTATINLGDAMLNGCGYTGNVMSETGDGNE